MRTREVAFFLALAPLIASCHGGGSGFSPTAGSSAGPGQAAFTINVPPKSAGNEAAQSAVVTLVKVNGNAPSSTVSSLAMNLTAATPGCTTALNGGLTCIARLTVPSGQDVFTVATYAGANSSGTQLSNDQVTTAISPSKQTSCVKSPAPAATSASKSVAPNAASHGGAV